MKNPFFEEVQGRFGFGCMRLPMCDGQVDIPVFTAMVDAFLESGLNYFDTAHGYLDGQSELALQKCLTSRYPRHRYILTNKLSQNYFETEADIRPLFEEQLKCCGVDYFDFYLMHAQGSGNYSKYQACRAYETAAALKAEGKIRHLGISFHDSPQMLETILTEHPEIEVVQIQFNYLDYEDPMVQSRECYEICRKHGKTVLVMEPVKGGSLVNLPENVQTVLDSVRGEDSYANLALRFAEHFDGICMVLSGMSDLSQMRDNLRCLVNPLPLSEAEMEAVQKAGQMLRQEGQIPCTGCRYCTQGCPQGIAIPDIFTALNAKKRRQDFLGSMMYGGVTAGRSKASDCVKCGGCEEICPQHLPVRELLAQAVKEFE